MSEAHSETLVLLLALWWTVRTVRARTDSLEFKASPTVDIPSCCSSSSSAAASSSIVRDRGAPRGVVGARPIRIVVARARVVITSSPRQL